MRYQKLLKTAATLLTFILIVVILVYGKPFMMPLTFGALLAMLLLPIVKWLQAKGVGKALATVLYILALLAFLLSSYPLSVGRFLTSPVTPRS